MAQFQAYDITNLDLNIPIATKLGDNLAWTSQTGNTVEAYIKNNIATLRSKVIVGGKYESDLLQLQYSDGTYTKGIPVTVQLSYYYSSMEAKFQFKRSSDSSPIDVATVGSAPYDAESRYYVGVNLQLYYTLGTGVTSSNQKYRATIIARGKRLGGLTYSLPAAQCPVLSVLDPTSGDDELTYQSYDITPLIQMMGSSDLSRFDIEISIELQGGWAQSKNKLTHLIENQSVTKLDIAPSSNNYIVTDGKYKITVSGVPSSNVTSRIFLYYDAILIDDDAFTMGNLKTISFNGNEVEVPIEGEGIHIIYGRALVNVSGGGGTTLIPSAWVQYNIAYAPSTGSLGVPMILVSNFADVINVFDNATLCDVTTYSGNGGNVKANVYLTSDPNADFEDLYLYKSINKNLVSEDNIKSEGIYSYNEEVPANSDGVLYLGASITYGGSTYTLWNVSTQVGSLRAVLSKYKEVYINENNELADKFGFTSNPSIHFSQARASKNNTVFTEGRMNPLLSNEGYQSKGAYSVFKVNAKYTEADIANQEGLFIKSSRHSYNGVSSDLTFEVLYDTEYVNGSLPLFSIGNIKFGAGRVWVEGLVDGEGNYTCDATFWRNKVTHVMITLQREYLPSTYSDTYNTLIEDYSTSAVKYNILKIYVNGCVAREYHIGDIRLTLGDLKLQIHPVDADVNFYTFRVYTKALNYSEVQHNYISSLLNLEDKQAYFDKNDIIHEGYSDSKINGTISLAKVKDKFNVFVHVIPNGGLPVYYGNTETKNSAVLVHYASEEYASGNGRFVGLPSKKEEGKTDSLKFKNQGSSANRYFIHNTSISKFAFQKEEDVEAEENNSISAQLALSRDQKYYFMPNDLGNDGKNRTKLKVKKLVGKVNYASSMQSHKPGSCTTYNDTYKKVFASTWNEKMYTYGRKGVNELPFMYFYYICPPGVNAETVRLSDLLESSTEPNVKFFGFQTWGSAKGDKETYGYNDNTPEYLVLEGGNNESLGSNFKQPWAAFQWKPNQVDKTTTANRDNVYRNVEGLHTFGESINFESGSIPWDIDFGFIETDSDDWKALNYSIELGTNKLKEGDTPLYTYTCIGDQPTNGKNPGVIRKEAIISLNEFVDFYNCVYLFDVFSLVPITYAEYSAKLADGTLDTGCKYYLTSSGGTGYGQFDTFRYDLKKGEWVPAGLHYVAGTTNNWEKFNVRDLCAGICNYIKSGDDSGINPVIKSILRTNPILFTNPANLDLQSLINSYSIGATQSNIQTVRTAVVNIFTYMFRAAVEIYTDLEDILFHEALIRVLNATDNKAKNTYFQIIGKIYSDGVATSEGDRKIRLWGDDLDTIFATNNNGQLVIPYYQLERALNQDCVWNDVTNALFTPLDVLYDEKISNYVKAIVEYLVPSTAKFESKDSPLYKNYFYIQDTFPEIAWNHHAEIFYETIEGYMLNGTGYALNSVGQDLQKLNNFNSNQVNPLSVSHGRTLEGEQQFILDRLTMLASMTGADSGVYTSSGYVSYSPAGKSGSSLGSVKVDTTMTCKVNQYLTPMQFINNDSNNNYTQLIDYDLEKISATKINEEDTEGYISFNPILLEMNPKLLDSTYNLNDTSEPKIRQASLRRLIVPKLQFDINLKGAATSAPNLIMSNTYTDVTINTSNSLDLAGDFPQLVGVARLTIDGAITDFSPIKSGMINISEYTPAIEDLIITNAKFNNVTLDFRLCSRLRHLDLSGCTGIEGLILPDSNKLTTVKLPNGLKSFTLGKQLALTNFSAAGNVFDTVNLDLVIDDIEKSYVVNSVILNNISSTSNVTLLGTEVTNSRAINKAYVSKDALAYLYSNAFNGSVTLQGNFTIVDFNIIHNASENTDTVTRSLGAPSFALTLQLIKVFGDLDSKFEYEIEPITSVYVPSELWFNLNGKQGLTINLFGSLTCEGNNISCDADGNPLIQYTLASGATLYLDTLPNSTSTGEYRVKDSATNDIRNTLFSYKVTVQTKNGPISTQDGGVVIFNSRPPREGDFLYESGAYGPYQKIDVINGKPLGLIISVNPTVTIVQGVETYEIKVLALLATSGFNGSGPDDSDEAALTQFLRLIFPTSSYSPGAFLLREMDKSVGPITNLYRRDGNLTANRYEINAGPGAVAGMTAVTVYGGKSVPIYNVWTGLGQKDGGYGVKWKNLGSNYTFTVHNGLKNTQTLVARANEVIKAACLKWRTVADAMQPYVAPTTYEPIKLTFNNFGQMCKDFTDAVKKNGLPDAAYHKLLSPVFYKAYLYGIEDPNDEYLFKNQWYVPCMQELHWALSLKAQAANADYGTPYNLFWVDAVDSAPSSSGAGIIKENADYLQGFLTCGNRSTSSASETYYTTSNCYLTSDVNEDGESLCYNAHWMTISNDPNFAVTGYSDKRKGLDMKAAIFLTTKVQEQ